jgi:hypothetical protein
MLEDNRDRSFQITIPPYHVSAKYFADGTDSQKLQLQNIYACISVHINVMQPQQLETQQFEIKLEKNSETQKRPAIPGYDRQSSINMQIHKIM